MGGLFGRNLRDVRADSNAGVQRYPDPLDLVGMLMRTALLGACFGLTGCTHDLGEWHSVKLDADLAVFGELGVFPEQRPSAVMAPGPSLIAGDAIAMQWAAQHVVSYAADDGTWAPAIAYLD